MFRDCLRYGTMAKGQFTEKPEKRPGKSPLPINGAVEYDVGHTKNGTDITMRFFDGNGLGALVATKTFRLESTARRDEFIEILEKLKAEHQRRGHGGRNESHLQQSRKVFASHMQHDAESKIVASEFHTVCDKVGIELCTKAKMRHKSQDAVKEAILGSDAFIAIISEQYFKCKRCIQEMRWALEAGIDIHPLIRVEDQQRIEDFQMMAPEDLRDVILEDELSIMIREDPEYWSVSTLLVLEKLKVSGRILDALRSELQREEEAAAIGLPMLESAGGGGGGKTPGAINSPGNWNAFLSHTQRDPNAKALASQLYIDCKKAKFSVWLDVQMDEKSEAAMKEGVRGSNVFVIIVTEKYFTRRFCVEESRWAREAGKFILPLVHVQDKQRIGEFMGLRASPLGP